MPLLIISATSIVSLFDLRAKGMAAMFNGQSGGVTQVKFSKDGNTLYSGGRKVREGGKKGERGMVFFFSSKGGQTRGREGAGARRGV